MKIFTLIFCFFCTSTFAQSPLRIAPAATPAPNTPQLTIADQQYTYRLQLQQMIDTAVANLTNSYKAIFTKMTSDESANGGLTPAQKAAVITPTEKTLIFTIAQKTADFLNNIAPGTVPNPPQ